MTSPPDAVSGAATPAQQCKCGHIPDQHNGMLGNGECGILHCECMRYSVEPDATPEAQIPERVPERWRWLYHGYLGSPAWYLHLQQILRELGTAESQLAALRVERDTWKWAVGAKDKQILELSDAVNHNRDQAEMWRVERDRAWNEALLNAAAVAGELSLTFQHRSDWVNDFVIAFQAEIRSLARPIPAEKPDREV